MTDRTVLIVDDEFAIRDMLRMALEMAGFRCIEAENIQQAYTMVVDERPDMLLLDWMLPGGSGLELLRRLKRNDIARELPVIMLTAKTAEDNVIQGLAVAVTHRKRTTRRRAGTGEYRCAAGGATGRACPH
jgi:two-component system phosphate regulon response regulator PhoB